jgi:hypothetical protein
MNHHH